MPPRWLIATVVAWLVLGLALNLLIRATMN
jgi:hypothetical protein